MVAERGGGDAGIRAWMADQAAAPTGPEGRRASDSLRSPAVLRGANPGEVPDDLAAEIPLSLEEETITPIHDLRIEGPVLRHRGSACSFSALSDAASPGYASLPDSPSTLYPPRGLPLTPLQGPVGSSSLLSFEAVLRSECWPSPPTSPAVASPAHPTGWGGDRPPAALNPRRPAALCGVQLPPVPRD